ncbi:putative hydrolase YxeP [Oxobacter pfennigii]|uniref:Putative hydrolase YxeP n=1 Tax=Oxobacter pfennigii TaxID=36849 RepID=A0A0P8WJ97_9CLOT|nr:M20 family metallopeptidase [Oxobacter pfennigii]KPU42202.1 putative hydrolase YxeP [Oxobacter pfennigii]
MRDDILLKEITDIRRHIHMNPEMGFEEYETSKYIKEYLLKLGIEVIEGIAKTGIIGVIKGKKGNSSVAVRADMDCLEVKEENDLAYCSKIPGLMHACGHDGHVASLLGLAYTIVNSKMSLDNSVILIFQPAEEGPGGAEVILKSKVLDKFNIKAVLSMHIYPEIEQGKIGCCIGPITARNGEIDIHVKGKSGHGALPHTGIDSVIAASQVIQAVQTVISRKIDPRENAVITLGKIYGGEARNILAGKVTLEGTIRAFSKDVYSTIKDSINMFCDGLAKANDCTIETEIRDMYPEVKNDARLFDMLIKAAGEENVEVVKPLMISEDFSYYREIAPQLFFLLGSRNEDEGFTHPLHNSKFNFDERILLNAIDIFSSILEMLDKE